MIACMFSLITKSADRIRHSVVIQIMGKVTYVGLIYYF